MANEHEGEIASEPPRPEGISLLPDPNELLRSERLDSYFGPAIIIPPLGSYAGLVLDHYHGDEDAFSEGIKAVYIDENGSLVEDFPGNLLRRGLHDVTIRLTGAREQPQPIFVKMQLPGNSPRLTSQLDFSVDDLEVDTVGPVELKFTAYTDRWQIPEKSEPVYFFADPASPQILSQTGFSFGSQR